MEGLSPCRHPVLNVSCCFTPFFPSFVLKTFPPRSKVEETATCHLGINSQSLLWSCGLPFSTFSTDCVPQDQKKPGSRFTQYQRLLPKFLTLSPTLNFSLCFHFPFPRFWQLYNSTILVLCHFGSSHLFICSWLSWSSALPSVHFSPSLFSSSLTLSCLLSGPVCSAGHVQSGPFQTPLIVYSLLSTIKSFSSVILRSSLVLVFIHRWSTSILILIDFILKGVWLIYHTKKQLYN